MSTTPSAKIIADSISPAGNRLITLECTMHRFVLAEMNTHRMFSRNSASSRAIPINKQIEKVVNDPAIPIEWGLNQSGMQANELITNPFQINDATDVWLAARDCAVDAVRAFQQIGTDSEGNLRGVHKQIANRLLEPFMWHTAIISSTDWQNFFNQRCTKFSPLAQPEMRAVADAMYDAIENSLPAELKLGEWHTPYVNEEEAPVLEDRVRVSAARCARVSYLTHDGIRDIQEDINMYKRLTSASPMHASPLEHVARPQGSVIWGDNGTRPEHYRGNFNGWVQLRQLVEDGIGIHGKVYPR